MSENRIAEWVRYAQDVKGHVLKRDDDGNIDYFVVEYEFHNGPGCVLCEESWCVNCNPVETINTCDGGESILRIRQEVEHEAIERDAILIFTTQLWDEAPVSVRNRFRDMAKLARIKK